MNMRVEGLPSQYTGYKINVNRVKQEIEKKIVAFVYVIRLKYLRKEKRLWKVGCQP